MDSSPTILLVDDEPAIRVMLRHALQRNGFTMLEADSGPAAIELTRRESRPIDVLVSDVMMPGMSGIELASELCAERPGLRVVLMTGYAETAAPIEPDWQLLHKPFSPNVLAEKIQLVCPAAKAVTAASAGATGESAHSGRGAHRDREQALRRDLKSAREGYVRASREYRRLIGLDADPQAPKTDRSLQITQAADIRKKKQQAYDAAVSRLVEFMRGDGG